MDHALESHHRDINGGTTRAAVFGVSDGLLTNVGLILGVAGAHPAPSVVRLAGLSLLIAGAVSMAVGEFSSVSAQVELAEHELRIERHEIKHRPRKEWAELVTLYESRGVKRSIAEEVATALMSDDEQALEVHAREELGLDPANLGAPFRVAVASFLAFSVGASLPLLPWLFATGAGRGPVIASLVLAAFGATGVGIVLARLTNGSMLKSGARYLGFAVAAASVSYAVGSLVGVTTPA